MRALFAERTWHRLGVGFALLAVLFVPSAWMLGTITPLWKDIDAYAQVTAPPGELTILLYCPAYCFLARVPLYLGYVFQCLRSGGAIPGAAFFAQPLLTDSGVFLLLLVQHVALAVSAALLIISATRSLWARFALAILWAGNPIFYIWAQTVGTEALSLILLLLVATIGLRIAQERRRVSTGKWILFGVLFALSMLTRHINAVLGALLPVTFLLAAGARFLAPRGRIRWSRMRARLDLRKAALATVVGLICIACTAVTMRLLSRAADIPYHSTAGRTFMFRLGFLGALSADERAEVVAHAVAVSRSENMRILLDAFRNGPAAPAKLDIPSLLGEARAKLPPAALADDNYDRLFDQTAWTFLSSPSRLFLHAVGRDFGKSQASTMSDVVASPFVHTVFYFAHPGWMPGLVDLATFRKHDAASIYRQIESHRFLRGWRNVSYLKLLLGWLVLTAVFVYLSGRRIAVAAYAVSLTLVGLLMMAASCLLTEYQSRFTLPMWQLLIVSAFVLMGTAAGKRGKG